MLDRDALADLIESGRLRQASSQDIADEIVVRMEDPAWAKAMSHPTRAEILRLLRAHGPMSPVKAAQLAGDVSLGTLSYHFRSLDRLGFIELTDTVQRRGAVEHIYSLTSAHGSHERPPRAATRAQKSARPTLSR